MKHSNNPLPLYWHVGRQQPSEKHLHLLFACSTVTRGKRNNEMKKFLQVHLRRQGQENNMHYIELYIVGQFSITNVEHIPYDSN